MSAEKGAYKHGQENKFSHLLQPLRDLASNWNIDIATELEDYLSEVDAIKLTLDGGHSNLNFAEAALLIQGSTCIYSRKVEYLYGLVLQVLQFVAHKRSDNTQSSEQDNQGDGDIEEEEEAAAFLSLHDIHEDSDINLEESGHEEQPGAPCASTVRPPQILLSVEEDLQGTDGAGSRGLSSEVAGFKVSSCNSHRSGALLLETRDSDGLDDVLRPLGSRGATPAFTGPVRSPSPAPYAAEVHPCKEPQEMGVLDGRENSNSDEEFDNGGGDGFDNDGGDACHEDVCPSVGLKGGHNGEGGMHRSKNGQFQEDWREQGQETGGKGKEEEHDPWALIGLDYRSPPLKPYRHGQAIRSARCKRVVPVRNFAVATSRGTVFPENAKILQAKMRQKTNQSGGQRRGKWKPTPFSYNKVNNGANIDDEQHDYGWGDGGPDSASEDEDNHDFAFDPPELEDNNEVSFRRHGEDLDKEPEPSYVDLCRSHMDALLKKAAEAETQTELASRVHMWKLRIEPVLEEQDARAAFDIHKYGESVLKAVASGTSVPGKAKGHPSAPATVGPADVTSPERESDGGLVTFTTVTKLQEPYEVSRLFSSMLQLINNGNITIDRCDHATGVHCFTAEHPFKIKLLSQHRPHEDMLHYRAPSASETFKGKGGAPRSRGITTLRGSLKQQQPTAVFGNGPVEEESNTPLTRGKVVTKSRLHKGGGTPPGLPGIVKRSEHVRGRPGKGLPLRQDAQARKRTLSPLLRNPDLAEQENVVPVAVTPSLSQHVGSATPDGKRRQKGDKRLPLRPLQKRLNQ